MYIAQDSILMGFLSPTDEKSRVDELIRQATQHHHQFQNEMSRRYAEEALQIATRIDYRQGIAEARLYIGIYYMVNENFEEAHKHFSISLELSEKIRNQALKVRCLGNIGNLQYRAKNYTEAKKSYERSLKLSILLKDKRTTAIGWQSIGNIHYSAGELQKAEKAFTKAQALAEEISDHNVLSFTTLAQGVLCSERNDHSKAFEHYREALRLGQESGNVTIIISAYKSMAQSCSLMGNVEEAIIHLETALALAEKSNLKYSISDLYHSLSEQHEKAGNVLPAYEYYDRYVLLRDVIYNEESNVKITEMQSLYELELKKKEAEIIRIKTEELQVAKDETERAFQKLREAQRGLIDIEKRNMALVMAVTANHEINQPLMIIKGNLELLEFTLADHMSGTIQKHFERINESIDRMEEILIRYDSIEQEPTD
jgi:tetratricopeptide (TPR) repeat protein